MHKAFDMYLTYDIYMDFARMWQHLEHPCSKESKRKVHELQRQMCDLAREICEHESEEMLDVRLVRPSIDPR